MLRPDELSKKKTIKQKQSVRRIRFQKLVSDRAMIFWDNQVKWRSLPVSCYFDSADPGRVIVLVRGELMGIVNRFKHNTRKMMYNNSEERKGHQQFLPTAKQLLSTLMSWFASCQQKAVDFLKQLTRQEETSRHHKIPLRRG